MLSASAIDWMEISSDKLHMGILLKPLGFTLAAYKQVFSNPNILTGYANTLFILIVGVIVCIFMTSLGAYVLSRKNLMWRNVMMMIIMFTMFFSGGMIPFYMNLKELHLTNSLWGLIIPFMINTYNMVILRTAFASIPDSLVEAAQIDGASHITILKNIVLPLSKATVAVLVLYYGVEKWNAWFWASCIIRDRELLPLQVILREILLSSWPPGVCSYRQALIFSIISSYSAWLRYFLSGFIWNTPPHSSCP